MYLTHLATNAHESVPASGQNWAKPGLYNEHMAASRIRARCTGRVALVMPDLPQLPVAVARAAGSARAEALGS